MFENLEPVEKDVVHLLAILRAAKDDSFVCGALKGTARDKVRKMKKDTSFVRLYSTNF